MTRQGGPTQSLQVYPPEIGTSVSLERKGLVGGILGRKEEKK